jgi:hypothetical protein
LNRGSIQNVPLSLSLSLNPINWTVIHIKFNILILKTFKFNLSFQALEKHCRAEGGYTGLKDVYQVSIL